MDDDQRRRPQRDRAGDDLAGVDRGLVDRAVPHRLVGDQHVLRVEENGPSRRGNSRVRASQLDRTSAPSARVSSRRSAVASAIFSAPMTESLSPSRRTVSVLAPSSGPMPPYLAISSFAWSLVSRRGIPRASRYSTSSWSSSALPPPSNRRLRSRDRWPLACCFTSGKTRPCMPLSLATRPERLRP